MDHANIVAHQRTQVASALPTFKMLPIQHFLLRLAFRKEGAIFATEL